MIELAKHIEVLLLENDCVIVPGLGGFIAHYRPSCREEKTGEFCPPGRTVGFNPQLVMNDGLLAQSYMRVYNTDFPDATRKIEKTVEQLKDELYQKGQMELNHVGTLYYTMNGSYGFEPSREGFFTPSLYGLGKFVMETLPAEKPGTAPDRQVTETKTAEMQPAVMTGKSRTRTFGRWWQNAAAVAAAVLLFFMLSVPVENTYVDEASYASLGSATLFDAIRSRSMASAIAGMPQKKNEKAPVRRVRNNVNTLKPAAVKTEKIAASPVAEKAQTAAPARPAGTPAAKSAPLPESKKGYYVIVASLTTDADACREVKQLEKKGYAGAKVIESAGRYRIALCRFDSQAKAYRKIQDLKQENSFKSAWVLTSNQ